MEKALQIFHIQNRLMHTIIINTVSLRHVSALKGHLQEYTTTDTFQQQVQQNEIPDKNFSFLSIV
jgi:hypothetical protein